MGLEEPDWDFLEDDLRGSAFLEEALREADNTFCGKCGRRTKVMMGTGGTRRWCGHCGWQGEVIL